MDIEMPEMDGFETTSYIRKVLKMDIPILALTAHSMTVEKNKILEAGATDYLSKPFTRTELITRIAKWVNMSVDVKEVIHESEDKNTVSAISLEFLKDSCGDNPAFMTELLNLFLDQTEQSKIELQNLVELEDVNAVKAIVHRLKSSIGIIGADMSEILKCEALIEEGREMMIINQSIQTLIGYIGKIQAAVTEALKEYEPHLLPIK